MCVCISINTVYCYNSEMPTIYRCCVPQCNNKSEHSHGDTVDKISFHVFPKDRHLVKKWKMFCKLHYPEIRLDNYKKNYRLCSDHFTKSDFRRDLHSEIFGKPTKNILKDSAVPSLGNILENTTIVAGIKPIELIEILLGNDKCDSLTKSHVSDECVNKLKNKFETQVLTLHQASVKREILVAEILTLKKKLEETNAERDEFRTKFKKVRNCYNKLKCTTKKKLLLMEIKE